MTDTSLLAEGVRSYPRALGALNEFQRQVLESARDVVSQELSGLSAAMRLQLAEDELVDHLKPVKLNRFDGHPSLGIKIDRTSWILYFTLAWDNSKANVGVSIWLRGRDIGQVIFSALKNASSKLSVGFEYQEIYIFRDFHPDDAERFPEILRAVIRDFSDLWTKVGGIGKFLK